MEQTDRAPGWYPHSSGSYEAYWDGEKWTGETREPKATSPTRALLLAGAGLLVVLLLLNQSDAPSYVLLIAGAALYFFPSVVARKKPNANSVFVLNLFLGWTLIGWVVALAMAVNNPTPATVVVAPQTTQEAPGTATAVSHPADDERTCPFCAETIKRAAVVCKHCGRDLPPFDSEDSRL